LAKATRVSLFKVRADERRRDTSGGVKRGAVYSVVLVHGGFVDGFGWEPVYQILRKSGHAVTVVQNPTISHADDVAVTKRALDQQPDQAILVGHSYGGAVITEAGNHPKVAALVYIAAFAPPRRIREHTHR
jgi:pimeloyl-ACP methyl ester carboxylesterase